MAISISEKNSLIQELAQLKQDHRELDIAIDELALKLQTNQLEVSRLKRRKLKLKDSITKLESKMIPNLLA